MSPTPVYWWVGGMVFFASWAMTEGSLLYSFMTVLCAVMAWLEVVQGR